MTVVRDSNIPPDLVLHASGISKSYAGVQALKGVSFDLRRGEVHALVGENGAGKSTFIKIVTGAVAADSGTLTVFGRPVPHNTPALARSLGVAAIYQQPSLFGDLTVAENIGLSLETGGLWRRVNWRERERFACQVLERAGSSLDPRRTASTLSMPEQQLVEIAKAIGAHARILIMDEPTASLTDREVDSLFRVIAQLRSEGAGIIYISHRLEEIATVADRVTVFRDGSSAGTRDAKGLDRAEIIRMMVGREVSTIFPKRSVPIGDMVLDVRELSSRDAGIHSISLTVRSGEIVGLAGLVGSGRTELAGTLFGLTPADRGEIRVRGKPVHIASPADAIRAGIGLVPEDRRRHGVVLELPIAANTSLASLAAVSTRGLLDSAREQRLAETYVSQLRIKTGSIFAEAGSLSGGNQQKVALARWLAIRPTLLILDEPTQGVDVGSKAEIHGLMMDLAESGLAILMISSELPELLGVADRIAVMRAGTIVQTLTRAEATQPKILALALGHQTSELSGLPS